MVAVKAIGNPNLTRSPASYIPLDKSRFSSLPSLSPESPRHQILLSSNLPATYRNKVHIFIAETNKYSKKQLLKVRISVHVHFWTSRKCTAISRASAYLLTKWPECLLPLLVFKCLKFLSRVTPAAAATRPPISNTISHQPHPLDLFFCWWSASIFSLISTTLLSQYLKKFSFLNNFGMPSSD